MSEFSAGGQRPESAVEGDALVRGVLPPLIAMAALGAIAAGVLATGQSKPVVICVVVGGLLVAALITAWAISGAQTAQREQQDELHRLKQAAEKALGAAQTGRGHQAEIDRLRGNLQRLYEAATQWPAQFARDIEQFAARVRDGEAPAPQEVPAGYVDERDPFARLDHEHRMARYAAEVAVLRVAESGAGDDPVQRLQVFANLGRRLQSLVNREIQMLDELEKQIEDPEILEGIFAVDHLATRIRRQAENLCVLGGARAPRQWSKPLTMVTTLRSAMQEVEFYKRVKMVLPISGTLRGHNVTEIIHLLAELIENATAFSAPDTIVMLSAQSVTAGLAIEVEDRGLGIKSEDLDRINNLLAGPGTGDVGVLLSDGRQIGLWVVAQLARRNEVRVRLSRNIFGGTTAAVVVPHGLLGEDSEPEPEQQYREALPAAPAREPRHSVRTEYVEPVALPQAPVSEKHEFAEPDPLPPVSVGGSLDFEPPAPKSSVTNGFHEFTAPGPDEAHTEAPSYPAAETTTGDPYGWPGDPVSEHESAPADQLADEQRPRLPKRRPGTNHLAPELRDLPPGFDPAPGFAPPVVQPAGEHSPTAIAAFRNGIRAGSGQNNDDSTVSPAAPVERASLRGESTHHDR